MCKHWPLKRIRVEGESKIGFYRLRYDHDEDELIIACMLDRPMANYAQPHKKSPNGSIRVWERMSKVLWGRTPKGLHHRYKGCEHLTRKSNGYLSKVWPQEGENSVRSHMLEDLKERMRKASREAQMVRERRAQAEAEARGEAAPVAAPAPPPPRPPQPAARRAPLPLPQPKPMLPKVMIKK